MEALHLIGSGLALALVAYVYSAVLTDPGMLLNGWYNLTERTLPEWLFKPLVGCFRCVAGQFALWYYLFASFALNRFEYSLTQHVLLICFTIFIIQFLHKSYTWATRT